MLNVMLGTLCDKIEQIENIRLGSESIDRRKRALWIMGTRLFAGVSSNGAARRGMTV